jgi:hypothetical protein
MATITTLLAQVEILLGPDDSNTELDDSKLAAMIKAAVERYSHDAPDDTTTDVDGDGSKYYDISDSLTSWSEGFSHVLSVEYPAPTVADDEPPVYLDPEDWQDNYWYYGDRYLFFPNHAPATGETIRVAYSVPYIWSGSPEAVDIPAGDLYALCYLAAGLSCQAISAKYSRTSDATIAADSVSHTTRAGEFAQRAKEFIALYEKHMGLGDESGKPPFVPGAGTFVDLDTAPSWPPGRQFLYHGRDTR